MTKTKRSPYQKPSTRLPKLPPNKNHGDKKKYDRKQQKKKPEINSDEAELDELHLDPYEESRFDDMYEDMY